MVAKYTTNAQLQKPATADRYWDIPINANMDTLDSMTAIGGLVVTTTEVPSTTLKVQVSQGNFRRGDGTIGTYAGTTALAMAPSATTYLWLTDSGSLTTGTTFPTTAHVRLAMVVTGATAISSLNDQRVQCTISGTGLGFILRAGDALVDGANFALGTTLGTQLGTVNTQKLGFFGSPPATQAPTTPLLSDTTGGALGAGVTDVGNAFNQSMLNANFAILTAKVNTLLSALKRHGLMAP
jgi:hypothetical protein